MDKNETNISPEPDPEINYFLGVTKEDSGPRNGWVYVAIQEFQPNIVKIGKTQRDPIKDRLPELSRETASPGPFLCKYQVFAKDYDRLERRVHQKLKQFVTWKKKEHFQGSMQFIH